MLVTQLSQAIANKTYPMLYLSIATMIDFAEIQLLIEK
jgi:hypothetical protein